MSEYNSGLREAVEGVVQDVRGRITDTAGVLSGHEDWTTEGRAPQDKADRNAPWRTSMPQRALPAPRQQSTRHGSRATSVTDTPVRDEQQVGERETPARWVTALRRDAENRDGDAGHQDMVGVSGYRSGARSEPAGVVVMIPAHNEQDRLGGCLESVLIAGARVEVPVRIVVVLDSCTDASASVVPDGVAAVRIAAGNVGAARRAGFDAVTTPISLSDLWYATTDADSRVPRDWLRRQLRDAAVVDVTVGTVEVAWSHRPEKVRCNYETRYHQPFFTSHQHVHGANLGIRAQWYHAVGGFAALAVHEDVDLVARLERAGARVGWITDNPVLTSDRRDNRVRGGFAGYLDRIERAG